MKKEVIKGTIIGVLVGAIIFGGIGSVVAYNIAANQIEYTPQSAGWKVNSVSEAIDSLYISKAGENYLTDEKVVGTWIDGKTLYQKSFTYSSNVNTSSIDIATLSNVEEIKSLKGYVIENNIYYDVNNFNCRIYYDASTHILRWAGTSAWTLPSGYVTIQYTKTTDTAPSQNQEG